MRRLVQTTRRCAARRGRTSHVVPTKVKHYEPLIWLEHGWCENSATPWRGERPSDVHGDRYTSLYDMAALDGAYSGWESVNNTYGMLVSSKARNFDVTRQPNGISYIAVVKSTVPVGNSTAILDSRGAYTGPGSYFALDSGGKALYGTNVTSFTGTTNLIDGETHTLVAQEKYEGGTLTMRVLVDGELEAEKSLATALSSGGDTKMNICGFFGHQPVLVFNGEFYLVGAFPNYVSRAWARRLHSLRKGVLA